MSINMLETKENYSKYMSMVTPTLPEEVQYANILFLNNDYKDALPLLEKAKVQDKANKYPNVVRMLGFAYYETGNNQKGSGANELFLRAP
jgi:predicted Zn-dependent protease